MFLVSKFILVLNFFGVSEVPWMESPPLRENFSFNVVSVVLVYFFEVGGPFRRGARTGHSHNRLGFFLPPAESLFLFWFFRFALQNRPCTVVGWFFNDHGPLQSGVETPFFSSVVNPSLSLRPFMPPPPSSQAPFFPLSGALKRHSFSLLVPPDGSFSSFPPSTKGVFSSSTWRRRVFLSFSLAPARNPFLSFFCASDGDFPSTWFFLFTFYRFHGSPFAKVLLFLPHRRRSGFFQALHADSSVWTTFFANPSQAFHPGGTPFFLTFASNASKSPFAFSLAGHLSPLLLLFVLRADLPLLGAEHASSFPPKVPLPFALRFHERPGVAGPFSLP